MPTPDASAPVPAWDEVVDTLDTAIVLFDPAGEIRRANRQAVEWLGLPSPDMLIGMHAREWRALIGTAFTGLEDAAAQAAGPESAWSARLVSAGVPRRALRLESRPLGAGGFRVESLRDDSAAARADEERARAEQRHRRDLETLAARLEQAEKFKMDLTANVTHDLRTPIASIKASVSGLLAGDVAYDAAEMRETLSVIEEECDRLQRRVQNLLSMARMEAGDADLSRDWVDLADVAASALEGLRSLCVGREVRVEFAQEMPLVSGDYIQLQIAVRNLIENAFLYSPADQPVDVAVSAGLGQVCVRVRDYGAGLMPDEFERVFDKFYRGRSARRIPGTGLGLAICRGIAEAHGGRLWAEHAPGGGVAFALSLPAADGPPELETEGEP